MAVMDNTHCFIANLFKLASSDSFAPFNDNTGLMNRYKLKVADTGLMKRYSQRQSGFP